jgi:hypothetical protein
MGVKQGLGVYEGQKWRPHDSVLPVCKSSIKSVHSWCGKQAYSMEMLN